jgi:hypothetical protein
VVLLVVGATADPLFLAGVAQISGCRARPFAQMELLVFCRGLFNFPFANTLPSPLQADHFLPFFDAVR